MKGIYYIKHICLEKYCIFLQPLVNMNYAILSLNSSLWDLGACFMTFAECMPSLGVLGFKVKIVTQLLKLLI